MRFWGQTLVVLLNIVVSLTCAVSSLFSLLKVTVSGKVDYRISVQECDATTAEERLNAGYIKIKRQK